MLPQQQRDIAPQPISGRSSIFVPESLVCVESTPLPVRTSHFSGAQPPASKDELYPAIIVSDRDREHYSAPLPPPPTMRLPPPIITSHSADSWKFLCLTQQAQAQAQAQATVAATTALNVPQQSQSRQQLQPQLSQPQLQQPRQQPLQQPLQPPTSQPQTYLLGRTPRARRALSFDEPTTLTARGPATDEVPPPLSPVDSPDVANSS